MVENHSPMLWKNGWAVSSQNSVRAVRIPPQSPAQAAANRATAAMTNPIGLANAAMAAAMLAMVEAMAAVAKTAPMAMKAAFNSSECSETNAEACRTNSPMESATSMICWATSGPTIAPRAS